jgi:hypothetical protein
MRYVALLPRWVHEIYCQTTHFSFNVLEQVSRLYKISVKIIVLNILIIRCSENRRDNERAISVWWVGCMFHLLCFLRISIANEMCSKSSSLSNFILLLSARYAHTSVWSLNQSHGISQ